MRLIEKPSYVIRRDGRREGSIEKGEERKVGKGFSMVSSNAIQPSFFPLLCLSKDLLGPGKLLSAQPKDGMLPHLGSFGHRGAIDRSVLAPPPPPSLSIHRSLPLLPSNSLRLLTFFAPQTQHSAYLSARPIFTPSALQPLRWTQREGRLASSASTSSSSSRLATTRTRARASPCRSVGIVSPSF